MSSVVAAIPPTYWFFSSTRTRMPSRAMTAAAVNPLWPAPMTIASYSATPFPSVRRPRPHHRRARRSGERGAEGHAAVARRGGAGREDLVDLDAVGLEADRRRGHVEPPHPRPGLPRVAHSGVPAPLEVPQPLPERPRVVLAQGLDVPRLEPGALDRGRHQPDLVELAVGEDVAVEEVVAEAAVEPLAGLRPHPGDRVRGRRRGGVADAVVQEPAAGRAQVVAPGEVLAQLGPADVLEHPDRAHGVVGTVSDVPV